MKAQMLKMAGVKDEKSFYKLFPDEKSFMAKYGEKFKKAQWGKAMQAIQPRGLPTGKPFENLDTTTLAQAAPPEKGGGFMDSLGGFSGGMDIGKKIVGGITDLIAEKKKRKKAEMWANVSDVALDASQSVDVDQNQQIMDMMQQRRNAQMSVTNGEELFPIYGTGTNILQGKNGINIKKSFNPNSAKTDKDFQKWYNKNTLEGKNKIPYTDNLDYDYYSFFKNGDYKNKGFSIKQHFPDTYKKPTHPTFSNESIYSTPENPGGQWQGEEYTPIGNFQYKAGGSLKKLAGGAPIPWDMIGNKASGLITEFGGENAGGDIGGTIGSTVGSIWGPAGSAIGQVIGQTGGMLLDRNPQRIKNANERMQRNVNMMSLDNIGDQFSSFMRTGGKVGMNGDLQLYDEGNVQPISQNPYLPEGGQTIMFRGPSHEDGGMDITYGNNPVEVEGGEPAVKLQDGGTPGDNNLVVFGNLPIHKSLVPLLGDEDAKGKKFKNYISDLSLKEQKTNKLIDTSTLKAGETEDNTSYGRLALTSLKANIMGANMKLKDIADKKNKAAQLQQAINDTAEENGLVADKLAVGKIKKAKMGKIISKAEDGISEPYYSEYDQWLLSQKPALPEFNIALPNNGMFDIKDKLSIKDSKAKTKKENFPWVKAINELAPYLRPSDAEALDPRQLSGEMFALSQNQLEPVQAQTYTPELSTPYNVSLQDIRNENQADYRSAQRTARFNPGAQAILNSQKYQANQKIGAEEFRMNQALKDKVYSENRNTLNDVKLKNLSILDNQYVRQSQAKTNTKAVTQAALNSISSKYLQNQLENRKLQTYENLYNYRYDNNGRLVNMNPLAEFDLHGNNNTEYYPKPADNRDVIYKYDEQGRLAPYDIVAASRKAKKVNSDKRNGAIVKALKNY